MRHINTIFPGFDIVQDDDFFKLSQDTVLLSEFVRLKKNELGLDLGAGVGCLSILTLLKNPGNMDALELLPGAMALAAENYARCGLTQRGRVVQGDLRQLPRELLQRYDVCVSNPPYFSTRQGKVSPSTTLAHARSDGSGQIGHVCRAAAAALKTGGRFYLCFPPARLQPLMTALAHTGLEPKRMRLVHQRPDGDAILVLLEARKGGGEGMILCHPLLICDENGNKTAEYNAIYRR